ncbi:hypothetical protein WAI453_001171 [Rhynchosporium graminicola]|uniref:Related to polyketide synthase n=1 Tax=Rhynchosporium graminicola TaxID=2792576 RepID=A0A1E1K6T6_9HELO|nr:related to polyketide synthase [Rhynchosporium commune]
MPYLRDGSSSSSSDSESTGYPEIKVTQRIVRDADYAGTSFEGCTEKPLSEQLEPIAVIGMGCRLPGDIKAPSEFWKMMYNKETGQTPRVPSSRFNIDAHFHSNNDRPGSFGVLGGYFLQETLQEFDPTFFGITPIEAMWMDPQQRKLLEVVYEAFESAGATLDDISGTTTAVFVASFTADFQQMAFKEPAFRHSLAATGVDPGIISNRISHVFNLNGPSIVVNTACSSSVYAIHNACNALRNKECTAAVVGGVNLVLTVDQHMNTAKLGVLSPTSTCHTFDASADGYGRAEGVGAVYLKTLSDAIRDGDPIRGLIRSSATNNNGKVPAVGITHPNLNGQANVIRKAYERGGLLDPRLTGYFECHGTGTAVGDPLEVRAVANAMNAQRMDEDGPLLIGAVKTNIGHSEAASGLSAVIKAILSVERGVVLPTRGVTNPTPAIDWKGWKVQVPNEPTPFPPQLPVKRVSVNSFGYGGTNAHIIVESADSLLFEPQSYKYLGSKGASRTRIPRGAFHRNRPFLLPFSAHDKSTLKRNIEAYGSVARSYDLLDLSYTLSRRRTQFPSRGMVVASHASLDSAFKEGLPEFMFADKKKTPTLGFVFTGQGAQWAKMGSELMLYYPSFLKSIRELDMALEDLVDPPDWTLEDALNEDAKTSRVNEAEFSQPMCTAIQIALVQLLQQWGIIPSVTVGHSSGEIAAAFAAGLVSASQAITLAYYRGKVVKDINTNGAMLAVGLGAEAVSRYLENLNGEITIACHNSPAGVTLSGNADALQSLQQVFTDENVFARLVKTDGKAYHSLHMQPAAAKYEAALVGAGLCMKRDPLALSTCKMVSSVTNSILSEDTVLDAAYWSANLLSPVLFNQAVQTIATSPELSKIDMLIEIGPHSAMSGPIRQIKEKYSFEKLQYLPSLIRGTDSAFSLLKLAGELFLRDYSLDMERITAVEESSPSGKTFCKTGSLIVDLPPYQWDPSKKFWAEARSSKDHRGAKFARHDVLGSLTFGGSLAEPTWRNVLRIRDLPWLKDHSLGGEAVFPAAGYFSMAMEAITQLNELKDAPLSIVGYILRDVSIKNALVTPDDDAGIEVLFTMRPSIHSNDENTSEWWDFNVSSISAEGFHSDHMAGSISLSTQKQRPTPRTVPNMPQRASGKSWNQALRGVGFDYGPTFQDMEDISFDGKTYAAACKTQIKNKVDSMVGEESRHVLHPASIDSCLQLLIVAIYAGRTNAMSCGAVPIQVDQVEIWTPTESQIEAGNAQAYSWIDKRGVRSFVGSNQLVASDGNLLMEITDMRCSSYEAAVPLRATELAKPQPYGSMVWKLDFDSLAETTDLDVAALIELANFKNPGLRVLEIGSENAQSILKKTADVNLTSTESISEQAEILSKEFKDFKNFKVEVIDPALDLGNQSFKEASFDIIISSAQDLAGLRKLLVVGGRLVLPESSSALSEALKSAGFSGIDLQLKSGITLTTAVDSAADHRYDGDREIGLVYRQDPPAILAAVKNELEAIGYRVVVSALESTEKLCEHIVMLADFDAPLLPSITEQEFLGLQRVTNTARTILWATSGGLLKGRIPEFAMASGLLRVLTSEQNSLNAISIDFDLTNTSVDDIARMISRKGQQQVEYVQSTENEYYISASEVYISRLQSNTALNSIYSVDETDVSEAAFDSTKALTGKIQSGKIVFETVDRVGGELGPEEVEVKVSFTGLNKEDILIVSGADYPTTFSHEIGGVVEKVGLKVNHLFPGDRVVGFSFDKFATFQRIRADLLQKLETSESLSELTSLPMGMGAALHGLKTLAGLQAGENVLILQGTGLAGAAAIQVTKALGGTPFVVVDTEAQVTSIASQFSLATENVLLATDMLQLKKKHGRFDIDVIFSAGWVNAGLARESWRHIAPFGRFVDCGRKNVLSRSALDTIPIARGANYMAFDMLDLYAWKPEILSRLLALTVALYRQNTIIPPQPLVTKHISELNQSVNSFSDDFETGKVLISHETSDRFVDLIPSRPSLKFRSDATYLLAGCLGGLGRSLTAWMMKKGARNFVFLSRSGADSTQASILVEGLRVAGADVIVVRGDITIQKDVERAIESAPANFPIRGVIQAAMVLRDGLFHNMSYDNWSTSTGPKVQGTMNLHAALKDIPLDFFVMTSSVSGTLGTPGQSNYAAGNSYLDSLARHRILHQKSASSIILPMVLGVGVVAEKSELEEALKNQGMYGIDDEHLVDSLEAGILEQQRGETTDHMVVGLDPSQLRKAVEEAGDYVESFWTADPRFKALVRAMASDSNSGSGAGASQTILATIKAEHRAEDAFELVKGYFIEKMGRILMLGAEEFEEDGRSVASYGIDSMIGAELRNWIFKELALDIPFQQLLGPALTINKFAEQVCNNLGIMLE